MSTQMPPPGEPKHALAMGPTRSFSILASRYLGEYLEKIQLASSRLTEESLWWRPHAAALSAGNLLLHLDGNLSLWILASLGGKQFTRERQREFTADRSHAAADLLRSLTASVDQSRRVIEQLSAADLDRQLEVQGYATDVRGVIFHVTEHMSYHTGQFLYIVKGLTAEDEPFDFYPQHRGE